jgi:hypothetical protein
MVWFSEWVTEAATLFAPIPASASLQASLPCWPMSNVTRCVGAAALALLALSGCKPKVVQTRNRLDEKQFPAVVLWAWERPEDLEFLEANRYAVAFLAQTLILKGDEVVFRPRHQPLKVSPQVKLVAVTRVESQKTTGQRVALSQAQRDRLTTLIVKTLELNRVSAVQIDFDAAVSEREFYRTLLQELRKRIPDDVPLSITALASFCVGDRWLSDLPIDEAVPMIFRMGADDKNIKNMLAGGDDFREPLCRRSYGLALDEPVDLKRDAARRLYVFNARAWTPSDLQLMKERGLP